MLLNSVELYTVNMPFFQEYKTTAAEDAALRKLNKSIADKEKMLAVMEVLVLLTDFDISMPDYH
jgi:hypothetical protein